MLRPRPSSVPCVPKVVRPTTTIIVEDRKVKRNSRFVPCPMSHLEFLSRYPVYMENPSRRLSRLARVVN